MLFRGQGQGWGPFFSPGTRRLSLDSTLPCLSATRLATHLTRCAQAVSPACLAVSGEVHVHVTRMKGRGQYKSLHGVESAAASTLLNRLLLVWRLRLCAHTGGRQ